mgnify:CR=1 FL=1
MGAPVTMVGTGGVPLLGMNVLRQTVDFTLAAWNTVATHEVFILTGVVRVVWIYLIKESLLSAGLLAQIKFGHEGNTAYFAAAQLASALTVGKCVGQSADQWWVAQTTGAYIFGAKTGDVMLSAYDLGYEITVEALTDGTMEFTAFWTPLSSDGNLTLGAGAPL